MKFRPKIWHLLLGIFILTIALRYSVIMDGYKLLISFVLSLFYNPSGTLKIVNYNFIDFILSNLLFTILTILLISFRKKLNVLRSRLNFTFTALIILLISFIFAPLITNKNPNFQKNLSVTKLLKPLSSVNYLHIKRSKKLESANPLDKLRNDRSRIIKESFDDSIIFYDSLKIGSSITLFQGRSATELNRKDCDWIDGSLKISSVTYLLGSDEFGRDIFTRIIYGSRISLSVGFGSAIIAFIIGLGLGFWSGYKGGIFDILISRFTDMILSFPSIFLVILVIALFGNTLLTVILVLGCTGWMSLYKVVKTEVVAIKQKDYIIAAQKIGIDKLDLLVKEILPVIAPAVIANLIIQIANIILAESALSYLGLGAGIEYPSWGSMIESGQEYMYSAWWMLIFPGFVLVLTLFSINDVGQQIKKKLNPKLN